MAAPAYQNYILLPLTGVHFSGGRSPSETEQTMNRLTANKHLSDVLAGQLTDSAVVLDTSGRRGAKLIRLSVAELPDLRAQLPSLRIVPEVFYYRQRWHYEVRSKPRPLTGQPRTSIKIILKDAETGEPDFWRADTCLYRF